MASAPQPIRDNIILDHEVLEKDVAEVVRLCRETGNFTPAEVEVAGELVRARLDSGPASGYFFIMARKEDQVWAYACYGPIPCTRSSWDLYWIVVDPTRHHQGLGRLLLEEAEKDIALKGGQRVYVETSSTPKYRAAQSFYAGQGYKKETVLQDFYAPDDDKFIFLKILVSPDRDRSAGAVF